LHQAGFNAAVAPLGTALTEEQLEELWRLSPSPILCFDGDSAGARAAARAAELALPMLAPDRTLRLATIEAGEDPDTLVRKRGRETFESVLDSARPLVDALYDLIREGSGDATPEQRAGFLNRLDQAAGRIPDRALADEYRQALRGRFYAARRRGRPQGRPQRGGQRPAAVQTIQRPRIGGGAPAMERGRILTAILLRHPALLHDVEHAYAGLELAPPFARLRDALLGWANNVDVLDSQALMDHLTMSGLQKDAEISLAAVPAPLPACALSDAMPAEAIDGWWHIFGFLNVERLRAEVAEAEAEFARDMSPDNQNRLRARREALIRVQSGEPDGVELAA
jgi:DNA primase